MNETGEITYEKVKGSRAAAKILCGAADIIEKVGWTKHDFRNYADGSVCVMGAIQAAINGDPTDGMHNYRLIGAAENLLARRLIEKYPDSLGRHPSYVSVTGWNDGPATKKEVMEVLRGDGC